MCNCTITRQYKYCQLLLWLTLNLPNLCISVYIYPPHPTRQPASRPDRAGAPAHNASIWCAVSGT